MAMWRWCMSWLCVPSVRMVQMRSTACHGPSWQYISSVGSLGEKSRWFTQSVLCRSRVILPVLRFNVKSTSGMRAASRLLHHLTFVCRLIEPDGLPGVARSRRRAILLVRRVDLIVSSGRERLVSVYGVDVAVRRHLASCALRRCQCW